MPRATRVPTRRAPAPRRQPAGRLAILPALVATLALALALVACDDAAGTTDGPQLAGTWTGSGQGTATMVGSLDGSGFDHVALTLTRQ